MRLLRQLPTEAKAIVKDALRTSGELFAVMIPAIVVVKILAELDLVRWLAWPLTPIMDLVGLPAQTGLVWATGMFNNFYGGMAVYLTLPAMQLTAAQATVLWTMILVAHSLPVELAVARRSGPRLGFQALARVGGAFVLGLILRGVFDGLDILQEPVNILLAPPQAADPGLMVWILGQLKNLLSIFLIITALLTMLRILKALRVIDLLNSLLKPLLELMGIGPRASTITIIGLCLGLSYGGGLIIRESRSGDLDRRDVFYSLTLMGLSHALFEDTLMAVFMGASLYGALWGRLGFTFLAVALLVQASRRLPARWADRLLWGAPSPSTRLDNPGVQG